MGLFSSIKKKPKKIGKSVSKEASKIGKAVSSTANSVAKTTKTIAKKSTKPAAIIDTTLGKIMTLSGKMSGVQALTDVGRVYKTIGRSGKLLADKKKDGGVKYRKRVPKKQKRLEKQVVKAAISSAVMFA